MHRFHRRSFQFILNTHPLTYLRDAGRLFHLRIERKLPKNPKAPNPDQDSGWRIVRTNVEQSTVRSNGSLSAEMKAAWAALRRAQRAATSFADLQFILENSVPTGTAHVAPVPALRGIDIRPWMGADYLAPSFGIKAPDFSAIPFRWRELAALVPDRVHLMECLSNGLAAEASEDSRALVVRVALAGGKSWLEEIATLPARDQVILMRLIADATALPRLPKGGLKRLFQVLQRHVRPERQLYSLQWLVGGLIKGSHPGFLSSGLRLEPLFPRKRSGQTLPAPDGVYSVSANAILGLKHVIEPKVTMRIWRLCGKVKGLDRVLKRFKALKHCCSNCRNRLVDTVWEQVGKSEKTSALEVAKVLLDEAQKVRWRGFCGWTAAIRTELCSKTKRSPTEVAALCQKAARWTIKEGATGDNSSLWATLRNKLGANATLEAAIASPQSRKAVNTAFRSWLMLDSAIEAVSALRKEHLELTLLALRHAPSTWCDLMKKLRFVPETRLAALFGCAAEHPLFACAAQMHEPSAAVHLLDTMWRERCKTNPLSERLIQHAQRQRELPPHLLQHDMLVVQRGWCEAQMHLLDELASSEVWRAFPGLGPSSGVQEHSLCLALATSANERPLRQAIRALAAGDRDWHLRHPANQKWLSSLPERLRQDWQESIHVSRNVEKLGQVCIGPERDLQEVLRMGTVVQSCLSAGSFNSFGAIANTLDANKLVLYARNESGKIIGRQLLAISATQTLVRFMPYPLKMSRALRSFFDDYDRVLARHLGLPMESGCYDVPCLVAKEWYDDGSWLPHLR